MPIPSESTAPATVSASNGVAPDDATASKEAAVEQHRGTTAPVEPETPNTTTEEPPASEEAKRIAELEARAAELAAELAKKEKTISEISRRDRNRRDALKGERAAKGDFEALYNETTEELETASQQLATATEQIATLQKALKAKEQEINELRKIELESFQEDDRKLAEKLSVPEIRALHQRLYGSTVTQAPPSVGIQRASVARPAAQPPKTLAEYNEQRYGRKS
jgi:chromosome segregation ATPase